MRLVPRSWASWIGPVIVLVIELPGIWTSPHVGEWFLFWYAGHLAVAGASPYDPASWLPGTTDYGPVAHGVAINTLHGVDLATLRLDLRWLWPPFAALVLAPFGALPLELGVPLLHIATIVVAIASALALVRILVPAPVRPLAMALLLASPSLVQPMRAATLTILVLPAIALLFGGLVHGGAMRLGLAAIGLSVRTQVFLATLPPVVVLYVRRSRRRTLIVAAAVWSLVNAIAFAISPVPLDPTLIDAARSFTLHDNSSTWRFAWLLAPDAILPVAIVMLGGALALATVAVRRATAERRDAVLIACALAFAVALAPYTHTYDHLVLFPAWLLALASVADAPAPRRLVVGLAVISAALVYGWSAYLVGAADTRGPIALTPYLAIALLALTSWRAQPLR